MVKPDPLAVKKRAQKERKAEKAALRALVRTEGIASAARTFLITGYALPAPSEECADCLRRMGKRAA